jgi:IMP dehydrogenase
MIDAIKKCRLLFGDKITIVAGNVITAEATKALIEAGAN